MVFEECITKFIVEAHIGGVGPAEIDLGNDFEQAVEKFRNLPIGTDVENILLKRTFANGIFVDINVTEYFSAEPPRLPPNLDEAIMRFAKKQFHAHFNDLSDHEWTN